MNKTFLLSEKSPNYSSLMSSIQDKMKDIFSQSYDEDLYHFVHELLTKPSQTKEIIKNELIDVFGPESSNVHKFLEWLWIFLKSHESTTKEEQSRNDVVIEIEEEEKIIEKKVALPKPHMLNINKRPMTAPPIKKTNINPNNQLNNNNLKHINNNKNDGHNIVIEQSKGKKGILERIKKPKLSPKMNDLNLVEPKKNLIRPPLKNDFKEKLIEKKMKFETQPAKNLIKPPIKTDIEKNENFLEDEISKENSTIKKRCRDWPCCKNDKCIFHHPTEQCKKFPKCSFGNQCLYIHPSIDCKFGIYCQRQDCAYMHPKMQNFQAPIHNFPHPFHKDKKPAPFLPKKNVTLNTTNDIKMKSNEELQKTDQEAQKIII